jgi:hypothetical protein
MISECNAISLVYGDGEMNVKPDNPHQNRHLLRCTSVTTHLDQAILIVEGLSLIYLFSGDAYINKLAL